MQSNSRLMGLVSIIMLVTTTALVPAPASATDDPPQPWPTAWQTIVVPANTVQTYNIHPYDFQDRSLYVVSVGLRMVVSTRTEAPVMWWISYDGDYGFGDGDCRTGWVYRDLESMVSHEWYPAEADWQSIKFITGLNVETSWAVCMWVYNFDDQEHTFEYKASSQRLSTWPQGGTSVHHLVTDPTTDSGSQTVPANSGLTTLYTLDGMGYTKMYLFTVFVWPDDEQADGRQYAVVWDCYKAVGDPSWWPQVLSHSTRHASSPGLGSLNTVVNALVVTYTGGSCTLSVNNWDGSPRLFHWQLHFYTSNHPAFDDLVASGQTCTTLPAGSSADMYLLSLDTGWRYRAWGRVHLSDAVTEDDYDHHTAFYFALGQPSQDSGFREGYKLRYWTKFTGTGDPWAGGNAVHAPQASNSYFWLHIRNQDTSSHEYCYSWRLVTFGFDPL